MSAAEPPDAVNRLRARRGDAVVDAPDTAPPAEDAPAPAAVSSPAWVEPPAVAATEAAAASEGSEPGNGRPSSRRLLVAAVLAAVVAAAGLSALTVLLSAHNHKANVKRTALDARPAIITALTSEVTTALSYDYRELPKDFAAAEAGLTPSFRTAYQADASSHVSAVARQYHAVTKATVLGAAVLNNTATNATVIAFVDQTSTNTQLSQPRLDRSRVRITMVKMNGKWLLNSLSTL